MKSTSDKELLQRLAQGDGGALKVLFERYFPLLAAVGGKICRDQDVGKDVAQKVFIRIWEGRAHLSIHGDIKAYLRRMAVNEALGRERTESRRRSIREGIDVGSTVSPTVEESVIADETRARINDAVNRLPDKTREVFVLSRSEQLSYSEISEALDISIKTVEYHMGKALIELRNILK